MQHSRRFFVLLPACCCAPSCADGDRKVRQCCHLLLWYALGCWQAAFAQVQCCRAASWYASSAPACPCHGLAGFHLTQLSIKLTPLPHLLLLTQPERGHHLWRYACAEIIPDQLSIHGILVSMAPVEPPLHTAQGSLAAGISKPQN